MEPSRNCIGVLQYEVIAAAPRNSPKTDFRKYNKLICIDANSIRDEPRHAGGTEQWSSLRLSTYGKVAHLNN